MTRTRRFSVRDVFGFIDSSGLGPSGHEYHRLVHKNGHTTLKLVNQPTSKSLYNRDMFITVVKLNSAWIALMFLACFVLSWFVFTLLYFIVSMANGDFTDDISDLLDKKVCVEGVTSFVAMFQFSMETQTTIGYGTRYVTEECPVSIILVALQSILGNLLLSVLTGVVLFKFQEPSKRAHTVLFSKIACVYEEDDKHYIEIQVLNMQRSQVIDPSVRGQCLINSGTGSDSKVRHVLKFSAVENSRLFFRPRVYRHIVDYGSPFWDFSKYEFENGNYEMIVVLNGIDEFTDSSVQVRTSFLPSEVKWGRHFKDLHAKRKGSIFKIHYTDFMRTKIMLDMSLESASQTFRRLSDASETYRRLSDASGTQGGSSDASENYRRLSDPSAPRSSFCFGPNRFTSPAFDTINESVLENEDGTEDSDCITETEDTLL